MIVALVWLAGIPICLLLLVAAFLQDIYESEDPTFDVFLLGAMSLAWPSLVLYVVVVVVLHVLGIRAGRFGRGE